MDRKQKEELRFLLKARKRANKFLAERRELEQEKLNRKLQKAANQELMRQYTQELTNLAEQSGILALAEKASQSVHGNLSTKTSFFLDYGMNTSHLGGAFLTYKDGMLRASHLSIFVRWTRGLEEVEIEIHVNKNGVITFHNSPLPIIPFVWKHFPKVLPKMLASAMAHPHPPEPAPRREWE